jgi:HEAT repeat protein
MEIQQIQEYLDSPDPQNRLKALTELKNYDTETVVPLLKSKMNDKEFLIRSFVAMGLGKKQNAESFAALLKLIEFDRDPNVRAEASNSLSLFGKVAASHLVLAFDRDDHWLVRRSILAALVEIDCPEELFEVCLSGLSGEDLTVKEASIDCFGYLASTSKRDAALTQLLSLVDDEWWRTRMRVAIALIKFNEPQAKEALEKLRQDPDRRVVGAVLESQIGS